MCVQSSIWLKHRVPEGKWWKMRQKNDQNHICHAKGYELYSVEYGLLLKKFKQVTDVIRVEFWKKYHPGLLKTNWGWKKWRQRLSAVTHACNLSSLESKVGGFLSLGVWDQPRQYSEIPFSTKNLKIIWTWCCVPVVLATRETERRESLEPRILKL